MSKKEKEQESEKGKKDPFAKEAKNRGLFGNLCHAMGEVIFVTCALVFGTALGILVGVIFPFFLPGSLIVQRYKKQ